MIDQLIIPTHIGITEQEQATAQALSFTLELSCSTRAAAAGDDLLQTVDYAALCEQVQCFVAGTRYKLIETLAERVAEFILVHYPVAALRLTLAKKPADLPQINHAAVTIARQQCDYHSVVGA